jgi:hypothetical protein
MRIEGVDSRFPNPPLELDAKYPVVRDAMLREIERRFGKHAA